MIDSKQSAALAIGCGLIITTVLLGFTGLLVWLVLFEKDRQEAHRNAPKTRALRVGGIVAVVMHEPGQYTLLMQNDRGAISENSLCRNLGSGSCGRLPSCRFVADAQQGQPMWATYNQNEHDCRDAPIVHTHGGTSFTGGGWTTRYHKSVQHHQSAVIVATDVTPVTHDP